MEGPMTQTQQQPQQPQQGAQGDHSELMAFLPMLRFMAKQPGLSAFFAGVGMNEMSKTLQKMRGKGHHKGDAAQPQPPAQPSGMPPGGPTPMAGPSGPAGQPNPLAVLALLRARQMQQGGAPPSMPPGA